MYNHLTLQMYDPTLERSDYVGTAERSPTIHNRGAVAHPEATTHDEDVEHIILSESLLNLQPLHG